VLQEFIANALRKPQLGITEANIDATLRMAAMIRVQPITHEVIVSAVILRRRYPLSHWDATIIAAAAELGCGTVYSEDMGDGQDYGGVRVVNPFA
jgi:predicted nucleic acid-binding protein